MHLPSSFAANTALALKGSDSMGPQSKERVESDPVGKALVDMSIVYRQRGQTPLKPSPSVHVFT